jgi:beta-glucanase (GH16 family)
MTGSGIFSQTVDRRYNPQYVWTTFHDEFSGVALDRNVWAVTTRFKRGLGFLIDSNQTINVRKGNLLLRMKRTPNYLDSIWNSKGWQHIRSDYVGGEVTTKRKFQYGVFECRARYAQKRGSWPAFWLIGSSGAPCPPGSEGSEIDIAELAREGDHPLMMHVIHRYYPPKNCDVSIQKNVNKKIYPIQRKQKYSTFKCIWTPNRIQYYMDDELMHEVINNNYEWFPKLPLNLILSQQVLQAYDVYGEIKPIAPQTSRFNWVRVKEFFLAPEISCPAEIPQQATVTLDVDSRATDIMWKLTPSSSFTKSEGRGKTVTIARTNNSKGPGKIAFTFKMPSGESFSVEKDFN